MQESAAHEHAIRRLISRASELKHRWVHELLDELGLYRGEPSLLHALWEQDGVTQSELTKQLSRSPSTITKTVQRLERAGLVVRRSDERDERVSRVYLTDAGRQVRPAVEGIWRRLNDQLLAGFSGEEQARFHDYLRRVCENIESQS